MDVAEIVDAKLKEIMGREFFDAGFLLILRDDELVELYRRYLVVMAFVDELVKEFHFQTDVIKEELESRLQERTVYGARVQYRQRRVIKDYEEIVRRMKALGYNDEALYELKELGVGRIEKMLTKEQAREVLDADTVEISSSSMKIELGG
jgi:hypothetical protein